MSAPGTATRRRDSGSQPRATYQDVLDAPPHRVAEIVDGVLHTNPRPALPHALAIEPTDHTLKAFELRNGEWVRLATAQDDAPIRIRPFEAVAFSLGDLWP